MLSEVFMNCNNNIYQDFINTLNLSLCIFDSSGNLRMYNKAASKMFNINDNNLNMPYKNMDSLYTTHSCLLDSIRKSKQVYKSTISNENKQVYAETHPIYDENTKNFYYMETIQELPPNTNQTNTYSSSESFDDIVLSDTSMHEINKTISRIAYFDSTILLIGESGTGKTTLAKYIHNHSGRCNEAFITINCSVIPDNLIESELFGYVSGAFTNANSKGKRGLVELADKGTLFLDEIGVLPYNVQTKLLQFVQEKTFTPVGSLTSKTVDVRIISATNTDLKQQVREKRFREDLYYRLRVVEFFIPPLRERVDAIEPIIDYFIEYYNKKFNTSKSISLQAKNILKMYKWPGNIRELQYLIERSIITSTFNIITAEDIPPLHDKDNEEIHLPHTSVKVNNTQDFDAAVAQFEKEILSETYKHHSSSRKVASALGITQTRAARLLRKYNIY